jgi:hypothetical protein
LACLHNQHMMNYLHHIHHSHHNQMFPHIHQRNPLRCQNNHIHRLQYPNHLKHTLCLNWRSCFCKRVIRWGKLARWVEERIGRTLWLQQWITRYIVL